MDLETFKNQLDIVQVIETFIPLKKEGANYKGLCPFHNEKTPSFVVSGEKQIYKCFGCDSSGDVINFYQNFKKVEFNQAVRELAELNNLASPLKQTGNTTNIYKLLQEKLQKLSDIWINNLLAEQKISKYLINRGFSREDFKTFAIGYADNKDNAKKTILSIFTPQEAQDLGLLTKSGFCPFSNRITITLYNHSHKPIGFVGRTHSFFNFKQSAKYVNSKETFLYKKSQNLYNYSRARQAILESKKCLVVEGYLDSLAAYKMGIKNCVATGGTAFNKTFLAQLAKLDCEITFLFDNDTSGQKAILRALNCCVENHYFDIYKGNLKNKVKDIAEIQENNVKTSTKEQPQITKSDGYIYYLQANINNANSIKEKDEFVKQVRQSIMSMDNYFLKANLLDKVKRALNIDLSKDSIKSNAQSSINAQDNITQLFKAILLNERLEYVAVEYLDSDMLKEYDKSFLIYIKDKTMDNQAQRIALDSKIPTLDYNHALKVMFEIITTSLTQKIAKAKQQGNLDLACEYIDRLDFIRGYELV